MVPWADEPWNEIVPNLWQGGHYFTGRGDLGEKAVIHSGFDLVVSLYQPVIGWFGPPQGVEHTVFRIPDGHLTPNEQAEVQELGLAVAVAVEAGRKVLVRCQAGYNRSGLVAAWALVALGHSPEEAVALIRVRRSRWALFNQAFLAYLGAKPDYAAVEVAR